MEEGREGNMMRKRVESGGDRGGREGGKGAMMMSGEGKVMWEEKG